MLVTAAYVIGPRLVQTVTAPKHRTGVGSDDIASSPAANLAGLALFGALVLLCAAILLTRLDRLPRTGHGRLVVALIPWVLVVLRDVSAGDPPARSALLYPLLLVTVWVLRPRLSDLAVLGYLVGLLAALALAMGVLTPELALYRSASGDLVRPDKLLVPWGVLIGPLTNGNNLGQLLSLGLPMVLLIRRRWVAAGICGLVLIALVWSASRSSMLAAAAALAVAVSMAVLPVRLRVPVAATALFATVLSVVLLPLVTARPAAFSNRGQIWGLSLATVEESPFIGHGSAYYSEVGRFVNPLPSTAYHGHNEFVQILVTGGVLYLLVIGALVVVTSVRALRGLSNGTSFGVVFLCALFISCTLEVSFGVVDRGFLLAVTVLPLGWVLFGSGPESRTARARAETLVPR